MALYEFVVLSRQDLSSQQVDEMMTAYMAVIEEQSGTVSKNEYWGLKSLSYKIRKNRKAHYNLFNIDCPPPALEEVQRRMRIDENILRFMAIRVEEHESGLSIMMQKRDRDDRRRRDDRGPSDRGPSDRGPSDRGPSERSNTAEQGAA
ncbi:MAG: 30S ribosomal protein S6 [Pseudomonadota bacterium]